ncbi:MAG: NAD+ synthase [Candidatus Hydrogenedentota bacterium]|nr:MAG: NAD+ synthase [Candidatus Hydrogenedentota bacterium]
MRIRLVPLNSTIGSISGNARAILAAANAAAEDKCELVVFPELALVGYPPKDLLDRRDLIRHNIETLEKLRRDLPIPAIVGFVEEENGRLYNAATVLMPEVSCTRPPDPLPPIRKTHLPTYDVFDEDRWFSRGTPAAPVLVGGKLRLGVSICEDLWKEEEPDVLETQAEAGADLFVNLSASPFHREKPAERRELLRKKAQRHRRPVLYCNAYGANDEIIFDGEILVFDDEGRLHVAQIFQKEPVTIETEDLPAPTPDEDVPWETLTREAIVLGIRDFFRKCGLRTAVVGLSGGMDSALITALTARALGPENVRPYFLPSRFTSDASRRDAEATAKALGLSLTTIPIQSAVAAIRRNLEPFLSLEGIAGENIQSRLRGLFLMAAANSTDGAAVLGTGNKSELAIGYATLYGDLIGALLPLGDVTKSRSYLLARRIQEVYPDFPEALFTKAPTAELRPNQTDEEERLPYNVMDPIIEGFVEEGLTAEELIERGRNPENVRQVRRWIETAEFKRKQAPPILKVTRRAFGPGWQIPIAAWR